MDVAVMNILNNVKTQQPMYIYIYVKHIIHGYVTVFGYLLWNYLSMTQVDKLVMHVSQYDIKGRISRIIGRMPAYVFSDHKQQMAMTILSQYIKHSYRNIYLHTLSAMHLNLPPIGLWGSVFQYFGARIFAWSTSFCYSHAKLLQSLAFVNITPLGPSDAYIRK